MTLSTLFPARPGRPRRRLYLLLLLGLALLLLAWPKAPRPFVVASLPHLDQVVALDPVTGDVVARVAVPGRPSGLCFTPKGDRVFVATPKLGEVASIDTCSWEVTRRFGVLPEPLSVVTDAEATLLQVKHRGLREDRVYGLAPAAGQVAGPTGTVPKVPLKFSNVRGSFDGTSAPRSNGRYVFSINQDIPEVLVSEASTRTLVSTIPVGAWPIALGWSPDQARLYVVVRREAAIRVIDPERLVVTASIPVDPEPNYFKPIPGTWLAALASARAGKAIVLDMRKDRVLHSVPLGGDIDWIDVWPTRSRALPAPRGPSRA